MAHAAFGAVREVPLSGVQPLRPRAKTTVHKDAFSFRFASPLSGAPTGGAVLHGDNDPSVHVTENLWSVPRRHGEWRITTLCCDVMCARKRVASHLFPRALLPERGHLETFSARTHLLAGVATLVYTVARLSVLGLETLRGSLLVLAAAAATLCFFSSAVYHTTSPDEAWSTWTRQLDFISIYVSLATGWSADLCITTREFQNVPLAAILDVPLSVLLVAVFFGVRRGVLSREETTVEEFTCSVGLGLYRRWQGDTEHTALRQATSLIVSLFTFSLLPVIVNNLGSATGSVIALQGASFVLILCGMVLDSTIVFPDYALSKQAWKCCVVQRAGCIMTAHGWWHVFAFVGVVCAICAREIAFAQV